MPSGNQRGRRKPPLRLAGLGIELAGAILGFTLLGLWIDRHFETEPWGLLICLVLGFVGGFYNLIRASFQAMEQDSKRLSVKKVDTESTQKSPGSES